MPLRREEILMNRDNLGNELKIIMEDEVKSIEFSQGLGDRILLSRKKTLQDRIKDFLNKEIELPLIPMVASLALVFILVGVPKDLIRENENIRIIDIGSSHMIIRDKGMVSRND